MTHVLPSRSQLPSSTHIQRVYMFVCFGKKKTPLSHTTFILKCFEKNFYTQTQLTLSALCTIVGISLFPSMSLWKLTIQVPKRSTWDWGVEFAPLLGNHYFVVYVILKICWPWHAWLAPLSLSKCPSVPKRRLKTRSSGSKSRSLDGFPLPLPIKSSNNFSGMPSLCSDKDRLCHRKVVCTKARGGQRDTLVM
jgi:hypothetical protein